MVWVDELYLCLIHGTEGEEKHLSAEISVDFQNKKFNVHFGEINSSTWKRVPEKFIQYVLSYHDVVVIGMQTVFFWISFLGCA